MAEQDDKPAGARPGSELSHEALDAVSGGVKQPIVMSNGDAAGTLSGMLGGSTMGRTNTGGVAKTEGSGGSVPPLK